MPAPENTSKTDHSEADEVRTEVFRGPSTEEGLEIKAELAPEGLLRWTEIREGMTDQYIGRYTLEGDQVLMLIGVEDFNPDGSAPASSRSALFVRVDGGLELKSGDGIALETGALLSHAILED
jgi:hypothetical protein